MELESPKLKSESEADSGFGEIHSNMDMEADSEVESPKFQKI